MNDNKKLFDGVVFKLDPSIDYLRRQQLMSVLLDHGATLWSADQPDQKDTPPTHIIADRIIEHSPSHLVLPDWVVAAVRNGFTHEPQYYYPDVTKFLTSVVLATTDLPSRDEEIIFGCAQALGAQCRDTLTSDVTHLVCTAPEGDTYKEATGAMAGKVKVILPHWLNTCFKLGRLIPEDLYLFPDPPMFDPSYVPKDESDLPAPTTAASTLTLGPHYDRPLSPKLLNEITQTMTPVEHLFKDVLVFFNTDVFYSLPEQRLVVMKHIKSSGGIVTDNYDDAIKQSSTVPLTVFIFKSRTTDLYMKTSKEGRMVANLAWVIHTLSRGYMASPLRSIWEYPIPRFSIPGMERLVATVTGYKGGARQLIFKLCALVGLRWTIDLEDETTLIICAKAGSAKYSVGRSRNFDIVNHLWLEESFQAWQLKSMTNERYTCYPDGDILQQVVGSTPIKKNDLVRWDNRQTRPAVAAYVPAFLLVSPSKESETKGSPRITQHHGDSGTKTEAEAEAEENAPHADRQMDDVKPTPSAPASKSILRKNRRPATVSSLRAKRQKLNDEAPVPKDPPPPLSPKEYSIPSHNDKKTESEPMDEEESSPATTEVTKEPVEAATPGPPSTSATTLTEVTEEPVEAARPEPPTLATTLTFVETPTAITTSSCALTKSEEKSIKNLGSRIVSEIAKADFLITDDRILRTPKFLCAVNLSIPIISKRWINDSIAKQAWCDPSQYQVIDKEMEETYGFTLHSSLLRAQQTLQRHGNGRNATRGTWLEGYEVCVLTAASAQPLKEVVETAGGKFIQVPKRHTLEKMEKDHTKLLALVAKEDKKRTGWKDIKDHGFSIYDKELVIVGSLTQNLALDSFRLD